MKDKYTPQIKRTGTNNYRWDGLTFGALLAIRTGLIKHDSILARDLVTWLDNNYPEVKEGEPKPAGTK